ncbi:hypothetical protein [Micromonospora endolithica]|uniref:Uncharacterized protein n=1 Tax=Micromonospora endolithica TaxID=230091 RepID=A0A3A9ZJ97_9ACTN|nr:hypothetical protein [Micromonospora endolithica]RKN48452.1 hypothetical protein D7223_10680 [Micromonospora endolithica]TWJ24467.1 hypothetical protein JD76_04617 [Micromonospora endolithica]
MADWDWSEDQYVQCLHDERRRFAWVMRRYGGLDATQAEATALRQYPFQASDAPYRGLVFHDDAWHWAMLRIYGERYWTQHPELVEPPADYRALD